MNEIQNNNSFSPIEWKGQVVITTAQLAEVYETSPDNVKRNFNRNKDRFVKGKHYYLLEGAELQEFKNRVTDSPFVGKTANQLYLWTRRGASRHCKILGTDKTWEQFDYLEETYFAVQQQAIDRHNLSPTMQVTLQMAESLARQELEQKRQAEKIEQLESNQKAIAKTFTKDLQQDFRAWVKKCITAIAESPNYPYIGNMTEKYREVTTESYKRLNQKKPCRLKQRVEAEKGRAIVAGASTVKVNAINKLTIIEGDKALKPIYETVLKEMMIAYCVNT